MEQILSDEQLRHIRIELKVMIPRCTCSSAAMSGECHPSRCFPTLLRLGYPKGGFNVKSYAVPEGKVRRKKFDEAERKRLEGLKRCWDD